MNKLLTFILWCLLSVYLFFAYHLLVRPAILDLSYWGILITSVTVLIFIVALQRNMRYPIVIYGALFLLADKALYNLNKIDFSIKYIVFVLVILLVIILIGKFYGKFSKPAIAALLITSILTMVFIPRNQVIALNHFTLKEVTDPIYEGEVLKYFPLTVKDIDGDSIDEIITFGNADEVDEDELKLTEDKKKKLNSFKMNSEEIHLYILKWKDGKLVRIPSDEVDPKQLAEVLPKDDPAFPYYSFDQRNELKPLVTHQNLTEGMLQYGSAPFKIMNLNVLNISSQLDALNGSFDVQSTFKNHPELKDVRIENGQLTGKHGNNTFAIDTKATQIIDSFTLYDGNIALLLLGKNLEVISVAKDGTASKSHVLEGNLLKNLAGSEFVIADIDQDNTDEILISSEESQIIKPSKDGKWEILWKSPTDGIRIEDIHYNDNNLELITQDKSLIASYPLRYVSGFSYDNHELKRNWKLFLPLIYIRAAQLDGDAEKELVAGMYGTHEIYVLEKHHFPVTTSLIIITGLLFLVTIERRIRFERKSKIQ